MVEVDLTTQGKQLVEEAPEVAQGLLVKGLEVMPSSRLKYIADALDDLVKILGAEEMPPRLLLSPEINIPKAVKNKRSISK